jgi:tetratricopeptide (TPR) repeat protein
LLPPYCAAKYKGLDFGHWYKVIGPSFGDVHHYCDALVYVSRYYKSRNAEDRKFFLKNAIDNTDYMFSHVKPNQPRDILLPEMHFTMGKVLILAKDYKAEGEFLQAIQLKPSYVDPYAALADFYLNVGKKQDALKILEEGLKQVPSARSLVRRYKELGGKSPLPVPLPPISSATTAEAKTTEAKTDANAPIQPTVSIPSAEAVPAPANEKLPVAPAVTQPASAAEDSSKIGSPTNPYCRFCPSE